MTRQRRRNKRRWFKKRHLRFLLFLSLCSLIAFIAGQTFGYYYFSTRYHVPQQIMSGHNCPPNPNQKKKSKNDNNNNNNKDRNNIMAIVDQRVQAELSKAGSSQKQINSNTYQHRFDHGTSSFASGLSRVKANIFTQHFARYPFLDLDAEEIEEDVLIIYNYPGSFPSSNYFGVQYDVGEIPLFHDVKEATQNCLGLNFIPVKSSSGDMSAQCLAIVGQYESYHTLHFEREKQRNEKTNSYLYQPTSWYSPPHLDKGKETSVNYDQIHRQHWSYLRTYLQRLDDNLLQLREMLSSDTNRIIIATTCCHNNDQYEKLLTFMCLLNDDNQLDDEWKQKLNNQILIFASDSQTHGAFEKRGVKVFFDESWTKTTNDQTANHYDAEEEYIITTGMNLLSLLEYNILYLPTLPNWSPLQLKRQVQSIEESASLKDDIILYDTKQINHSKYMNACYIQSNPTTKYFLKSLLFSSDRIILSENSSFQKIFNQLLQEHSSLFNLQISVINERDNHNVHTKDLPCRNQFWTETKLVKSNVHPHYGTPNN